MNHKISGLNMRQKNKQTNYYFFFSHHESMKKRKHIELIQICGLSSFGYMLTRFILVIVQYFNFFSICKSCYFMFHSSSN